MRVRKRSIGCLSLVGITAAIIAIIAMLNPMAFGFFAAMGIGITEMALTEATFIPREAIVQKYEKQCAPTPFLISSAQPKCTIDGQDGAMLNMVTLKYDTMFGYSEVGATHHSVNWGTPPVGSRVTIRVSLFDSSKFKLQRGGWISPGWCGDKVCR